jgi:hypothetical protein
MENVKIHLEINHRKVLKVRSTDTEKAKRQFDNLYKEKGMSQE